MKKIIGYLSLTIAILVAAVYIFIPGIIKSSAVSNINCNADALKRALNDSKKWAAWWPGDVVDSVTFKHNGYLFRLQPKQLNTVSVVIEKGKRQSILTISPVQLNSDTTRVFYTINSATSYYPHLRLKGWLDARKLKKEADFIAGKMAAYFTDLKNMYGYTIVYEKVKDSTFVFTAAETTEKPSAAFIYNLAGELKNYISKNKAVPVDSLMLNINKAADSIHYIVKVAFPVNKKIPDASNIFSKWMPVGGKMLVMEVKGGNEEIANAFHQFQLYVTDYKRVAPAIPYQVLTTNRLAEPDSSKWITKIYYPVM